MSNRPYKHVVLEQPIVVGSGRNEKRYLAITVRQPIARDLSKAARAKTTIDAVLVLIAGTSGLPMSVVEQLSEPDFMQCLEFYDAICSISLAPISQSETKASESMARTDGANARGFGLSAAAMQISTISR